MSPISFRFHAVGEPNGPEAALVDLPFQVDGVKLASTSSGLDGGHELGHPLPLHRGTAAAGAARQPPGARVQQADVSRR